MRLDIEIYGFSRHFGWAFSKMATGVLMAILLIGPVHAQRKGMTEVPGDSLKKVKTAAIPMFNYNRSFGFMYGAIASMYYKVSQKDTISPSSSTMLFGMYSTSQTYMAMVAQQLYLNKDRWRIKFVTGMGNIYFQYYQDMPSLPPPFGQIYDDGIWIDFITDAHFAMVDARRKILNDFYVGPIALAKWVDTEYDLENPITGQNPTNSANMISLGYGMLHDSRDNVNFPTKGYFVQFKNNFIRKGLGSSNNFNQYQLEANHFWDIKKNANSILVSRINVNVADGDVPFQGENYIGQDDLRGYSEGKYRGNQVYDIQAELRQHLIKRFGMIGFLGVGTVVDKLSEISEAPVLPSIGVGLRYMMIPSEKINVGIDVGVGKDDWSLTFRIGETFGR